MEIKDMIAVLQAAERGEEIECAPICSEQWRPKCHPDWTFNYFDYRIKPKPRMVPLEPSDVPPGSVVRITGQIEGVYYTPLHVTVDLIRVEHRALSFKELQENWQISRDGGRTWSRCEKPESV